MADSILDVVQHFRWSGPVGCAFPAVVKEGVVCTAVNVDERWIDTNGQQLFQTKTRYPVYLLNDADAAGLAQMHLGAGKGHVGIVIMVTFGTGIGSAVFLDGRLLPNTELGHIEIRGKKAERRASNRARQRKGLSWRSWAALVDKYLTTLEALFSPDLFIIGGGVSRKHAEFLPRLKVPVPVMPAQLLNEAGIVGAALAAREHLEASGKL